MYIHIVYIVYIYIYAVCAVYMYILIDKICTFKEQSLLAEEFSVDYDSPIWKATEQTCIDFGMTASSLGKVAARRNCVLAGIQRYHGKPSKTMPGWWLGHPSEKYEFVNWDDEINPIFLGK